MSTTPETELRVALDAASRLPDLTLDPRAVLDGGHRAVRRRRVVAAGVGLACAAAIGAFALQLGDGLPRALPPAHTGEASGAPTGPLAASGTLTYSPGDEPSTRAVRLDLADSGSGLVRETWSVLLDGKPVRTVTRTVPRPAIGQASVLMPNESGQPGLYTGWVDTGSAKTTGVGGALPPGAVSGTTLQGATQAVRVRTGNAHPYLFTWTAERIESVRPLGVRWSQTGATPTQQRVHYVAAANPPAGYLSAVLPGPDGESLVFADEDTVGLDAGGLPVAWQRTGPLQAGSLGGGVFHGHDRIIGWVDGTAGPTVRSSDPADAWTVSGVTVQGRRAFVVTAKGNRFAGTITLSGAGVSVPVTIERDPNLPGNSGQ